MESDMTDTSQSHAFESGRASILVERIRTSDNWTTEMRLVLKEERLRLLDELEVGFANNPKHHTAVIYRVREAIEAGIR